jgi:hypothetical protein
MTPAQADPPSAGVPVVLRLGRGHYIVNGEPKPGVTPISNMPSIEQLGAWGQNVAVAGICELARTKRLHRFDDEERISEALRAYGLGVGAAAAKSRALGTTVHEGLEVIAAGGVIRPEDYPDPDCGYVRALIAGIEALRVTRFVASELVVGSAVHGYAGTLDLIVETEHRGRVLVDVKTSKAIYETAHLQIAAYAEAATECGHGPFDHSVVLRLAADGGFEFVRGRASIAQFVRLKNAYMALRELREAIRDA